MDRRRMLNGLKAAQELDNYAEAPVMPTHVDPQIHVSRNTVPQPFYLVCEKDTVLAQMSGSGVLQLKNSSVNYFSLDVGDHVYVPAGTPHRIVPSEESVMLRYKPLHAGLEGVAWYCPGCGEELHRTEWDTADTVSQQAYYDACSTFNQDESQRTCTDCGSVHPTIELSDFASWLPLAEKLRGELVAN